MRSPYPWINQAHRIYPLPRTSRMFEIILSTRAKPCDS
jgi:hypothetical protein